MDGISAAASVVAVATAGIQISIKLTTFSLQVGTASDRIRNIGADVSLTSNVLQQLGDLLKAKVDDNESTSIFNAHGRMSTQNCADTCNRIFRELEAALKKASRQIRSGSHVTGEKVMLSKLESLKWPFLQPSFDGLRSELRDSRETMMLILQVTTLAYYKKLAQRSAAKAITSEDQVELVDAIMALKRTKNAERANSPDVLVPQESEQWEIEAPQAKESRGHIDPPSSSDVRVGTNPTASLDNVAKPSSIVTKKTSPESTQESKADSPISRDLGNVEDVSNTSTPANVTSYYTNTWEEWQLVPHVTFVGYGYDIRWQLTSLPTQQQEIGARNDKMQRWGKKRPLKQLSDLDIVERAALERRIMEENTSPDLHSIVLLGVSQREENIAREILAHIPCHCTTVIVRKEHLGAEELKKNQKRKKENGEADKAFRDKVPSTFGSAGYDEASIANVLERVVKGKEHYEKNIMDLTRPTYIKVHRKHLSPDTLDAYEIPWERAEGDPDYLVIKRWIPERDQEILFEHTRRLREGDSLTSGTTELEKERDKFLLVRKDPTGKEQIPAPEKGHLDGQSFLFDSEFDKPPHRQSYEPQSMEESIEDDCFPEQRLRCMKVLDEESMRGLEEFMRGEGQSVPQQKTDSVIERLLDEYTTLYAEKK